MRLIEFSKKQFVKQNTRPKIHKIDKVYRV